MRSALYVAGVATARFNLDLEPFFTHLTAAGKSALIAVARKLLAIANAVIRDMKRWRSGNPTPAAQNPSHSST